MPTRTAMIILGDWLVDEYWFLMRQLSSISSHTGSQHFRVSPDPRPKRTLSGAGHVARLLHKKLRKTPGRYKLFCFGEWNSQDQSLLNEFFHADRTDQQDLERTLAKGHIAEPRYQLRLTSNDATVEESIKLKTLRPQAATTRIIRLYHGSMADWIRVDWQQPAIGMKSSTVECNVKNWLEGRGFDDVAVIVYDLGKGAVTPERVESLANYLRNYSKGKMKSRWYIWSPKRLDVRSPEQVSWWRTIEKEIQFLLLGPTILGRHSALNTWLVEHRISRECLETLDRFGDVPVTALLTKNQEIAVRFASELEYFTAAAASRSNLSGRIGWASAMFGSLVYQLSVDHCHRTPGAEYWNSIIERAFSDAENESFYAADVQRNDVGAGQVPNVLSRKHDSWSLERALWEEALDAHPGKMGIIGRQGDEARLDVWRSSTDLPGYIACLTERREVLRRVAAGLRAFKRSSRRRSLSILLIADPGSGKTVLAKKLAEAFDFSFISCDLTQMTNRDVLSDFFDSVRIRQSKSDRDVLVFVDELNAPVGSNVVYSAFMRPLENGNYSRGLQEFDIDPCVWIFAGTGLDSINPEAEPKKRDLLDRIALKERLDYKWLMRQAGGNYKKMLRIRRELRLEQVYLGASMIKSYHPDVTHVACDVLWRFYALQPKSIPSRHIARRAALLKGRSYPTITRDDWEGWDDERGKVPRCYRGGELVRLVTK